MSDPSPTSAGRGDKPILITGFAPTLEDPEVLDRQVRELERQLATSSERSAVVLLTQSSYGNLIRRRQEAGEQGDLSPSSPLRRLINLLAPFTVYLGHDVDLATRADDRRKVAYDEHFADALAPPVDEAAERGASRWPRGMRWLPRAWRSLRNCLGEKRLYDNRRRQLYDVLHEEGRPTRHLQRIALRLFRMPKEDSCTIDQIVSHVGLAAGPYYEAIWASCGREERIVLAQLAWEGVANPKAYETILDLLHKGLVCRDPILRLMNRSFQSFVRRALPRWQLVELEEESGTSAWSILKWLLPLPLLLLGGFLFLTQQDAVSNVIGLAIAIGSLVPTFVNLYQQFQQVSAQRARGAEE